MGVALIAECPAVDIKYIISNVTGMELYIFLKLDNRVLRQIEQGERASDAVFCTVLAHYREMYAFHDEIGVIDETGEGPG